MSFWHAVGTSFVQYSTLRGRTSRYAFWCFVIFSLSLSMIATALDTAFYHDTPANAEIWNWIFGAILSRAGPVGWAITIALFVPSLTITVRRLHDINLRGWWFLGYAALCVPIFLNEYKLIPIAQTPEAQGLVTIATTAWLLITILLMVVLSIKGSPDENRFSIIPRVAEIPETNLSPLQKSAAGHRRQGRHGSRGKQSPLK